MRNLRRFALASASALGLALTLDVTVVGVARAGDVTYPDLTQGANVQDADLIATWRTPGPLTRINASVLATYIQGKLGGSFLQTANALSELTSAASTARVNLGLGTAATEATGTSGNTLCLLNTNCTVSGTRTFSAAVGIGSTLGVTGLLTASGGVSATTLSASGAATLSGGLSVSGGFVGVTNGSSTAGGTYYTASPTNFGSGSPQLFIQKTPSDPLAWTIGSYDGTNGGTGKLTMYWANTTFSGAATVDGALAAAAVTVSNGLTVASGAVTFPSGSVNGAAIASGTIGTTSIANGAVANAQHANMAANTIKGNASGSAAAPQDLSGSQVMSLLGISGGGGGTVGTVSLPIQGVGTVVVNWGQVQVSANSSANVTFSKTYSGDETIVAGIETGNTQISNPVHVFSRSLTGFVVRNDGSQAVQINWISIGT